MIPRKITKPTVCLTREDTEGQSLKEGLDLLPANEIIKKGDRVVITPNWVKSESPSAGTVVGPKTLQKLIKHIKKFEPSKITVATGSGGDDTKKVFESVGYDKVIESEEIEFVDLNFGPYTDVQLDHDIIKETKINKLINEFDVLISFTQLKHHEEATISASIKNITLGWPPAEMHGFPKKKTGIHEDLHGFIIAMAKKIPIHIAIVSADKAMVGLGPSGGKPVDTDGLIIVSNDSVAADAIGARLLGFLPQGVRYLYALHKSNMGEADPKKMTFKGFSLAEAEKIFSKAAYGQRISLDKENKIKGFHGKK
ncbi:DUF362 domain-containing protein [Proteinivorax tanatarense]|uniref:DUF362 domain-containing protein n=1 Tax=Proteinivorax tanatarense TaxID=1260629 RepID=A0AAU7VJW8_9FIRM